MTRCLLAIALLGIAPALCRAQAPEAAPAKVPFEMLAKGKSFSGHIAVQATINGKGPYRLIFDTGAPMMLLTTRVAKDCGLLGPNAKKPAVKSLFAPPGQVTIGKFEIGGLEAQDLPAIAFDHPTVSAMAQMFGPIEGIVGFPFFARYRTAIDYQAKELTMTPNGYQPGDVMQSLMTNLMGRSKDRNKPMKPRMLAPAAQWGFRVEKPADDEPGVVIAEVWADSAAAKAGLKAGDRLLTLDGRWTDSEADVYEAALAVKPNARAIALVKRADAEVRVPITPQPGS